MEPLASVVRTLSAFANDFESLGTVGSRVNTKKLGNFTDIVPFLFSQERNRLDAYRPILLKVQKGICLYCQKSLSKRSLLDHFVLSSLAHNLPEKASSFLVPIHPHDAVVSAVTGDVAKVGVQLPVEERVGGVLKLGTICRERYRVGP